MTCSPVVITGSGTWWIATGWWANRGSSAMSDSPRTCHNAARRSSFRLRSASASASRTRAARGRPVRTRAGNEAAGEAEEGEEEEEEEEEKEERPPPPLAGGGW